MILGLLAVMAVIVITMLACIMKLKCTMRRKFCLAFSELLVFGVCVIRVGFDFFGSYVVGTTHFGMPRYLISNKMLGVIVLSVGCLLWLLLYKGVLNRLRRVIHVFVAISLYASFICLGSYHIDSAIEFWIFIPVCLGFALSRFGFIAYLKCKSGSAGLIIGIKRRRVEPKIISQQDECLRNCGVGLFSMMIGLLLFITQFYLGDLHFLEPNLEIALALATLEILILASICEIRLIMKCKDEIGNNDCAVFRR